MSNESTIRLTRDTPAQDVRNAIDDARIEVNRLKEVENQNEFAVLTTSEQQLKRECELTILEGEDMLNQRLNAFELLIWWYFYAASKRTPVQKLEFRIYFWVCGGLGVILTLSWVVVLIKML